MEQLKQELQALSRLIHEKQQPAEALIRRWLKQRDPNFTAAEVAEHVRLGETRAISAVISCTAVHLSHGSSFTAQLKFAKPNRSGRFSG